VGHVEVMNPELGSISLKFSSEVGKECVWTLISHNCWAQDKALAIRVAQEQTSFLCLDEHRLSWISCVPNHDFHFTELCSLPVASFDSSSVDSLNVLRLACVYTNLYELVCCER
jgi:hypothetical protein